MILERVTASDQFLEANIIGLWQPSLHTVTNNGGYFMYDWCEAEVLIYPAQT